MGEWPGDLLAVTELEASGWRPVPFQEFILKIAQRCNLACDYCYIYSSPDQSWRDRPVFMSPATVARAATRIAEHVTRHGLGRIRVVLHGGEPLLAGVDRITAIAAELRAAVPDGVTVDLSLQTNAVLLDEPMLHALRAAGIRVGVSLDGDATGNDRHRRYPDGRGSHAAAVRGLRLLSRDEHRDLFSGVLCVVDLRNDPVATYEALLEFRPPRIDLLLPHANWAQPPLGPDGYADWLMAVFDRWFDAPARETGVVLFEEIISLLLGGGSRCEQVGLSPAAFLVVDSDGSLQQTDSLKTTYPGAPETGLSVWDNDLDDALRHPAVAARQIGVRALAATCRSCPVVQVCGGGHYAHRYTPGSGFRHPSVYCRDLSRLIGHIRGRLTSRLGGS
ncbi:FxsB family cyclophane-forming radical SAM/SPASM peptide maturase [Actinoplanes awajinensis]|uniref:FxsB family radical SAM/SPASM domain protein n=1 Tax=Actinoplanes awajinensis subsp. mycoplanecinus TaxID=135947 RepID=A0A101JMG1_9ACTN|nr:FxsB family cyclophane-forming radical SAM/SPASM peptide maturase [Actinoplanes awajinensis]KUL29630.1 FxsB family radical SAM/SPASM domain protein [Actinoplanes awajinensis subsp. mycoplanecinus]